jgi:hypothetical protein
MLSLLKICLVLQTLFIFYPLANGWAGGIIRSIMSGAMMLLLVFVIMVGNFYTPPTKFKTSLVAICILQILATILGLFKGYPIKSIFSDILPPLEYVTWFFITITVAKESSLAKDLVRFVCFITGLLACTEVSIYIFNPSFYYHQVAIAGIAFKRIVDFIVPIGFILLTTITFNHTQEENCKIDNHLLLYPSENNKDLESKGLAYVFIIAMLISICMSFLKSSWIGMVLVLFVIPKVLSIFKIRDSNIKKTKRSKSLIIATILIVCISFLLNKLFDINIVEIGIGLLSQLSNDDAESFERSTYPAIVYEQLSHSVLSPLFGLGLGAGFETTIGETNFSDEKGSTMWRSEVPSYPLFIFWKTGMTGLVLWFILFLSIRNHLKLARKIDSAPFWKNYSTALGSIYGFVVFISTFAFTPYTHYPIMMYLGVLTGILSNYVSVFPHEGRTT